MVTFIVFVLILGLLVFVHELGHFLMAKRAGVKVEEFAFGFRPRIWGKKVGETIYAINAIPLGGYVLMEGETEKAGPRSFMALSPLKRVPILLAGVVMNAVLAWILITVIYIVGALPLSDSLAAHPGVSQHTKITITQVMSGSPAANEGLKTGDVITAIDRDHQAGTDTLIRDTTNHPGVPVVLTVNRGGRTFDITVTPRIHPPAGQGAIGIVMETESRVRTAWYRAPFVAILELGSEVKATVYGLSNFAQNLVVHQRVGQDVSGLIGIGEATGVVRRLGFTSLLQFIGIISINLAVVNLVPILPLDGGHVVLSFYEAWRKRPVSDETKGRFAAAGLLLIGVVFVVVTYHDAVQFQVFGRLRSFLHL